MKEETAHSVHTPLPMKFMQLIWPGAIAKQAIYTAAKLGIADLLAALPRSVDDLAAATSANTSTLERLLRALSVLELFYEDTEGKYHNSDLSELLRTDHPQSMYSWAIMLGAPFFWKPSGELYESVLTGQPAFNRIFKVSFFEHLASQSEDADVFNKAMAGQSGNTVQTLVEFWNFSRFKHLVDVGGGTGELLLGILEAYPNLDAILFELPDVIKQVKPALVEKLQGRLELQKGSFFEHIPEGADLYILNRIIHDWPDNDAVRILANCRRSIGTNGCLLLIENILDPSNIPAQAMMDLLMLVLTGGRERTREDFQMLLEKGGFSITDVSQIRGVTTIEARPV